jgi:hypothetical protein
MLDVGRASSGRTNVDSPVRLNKFLQIISDEEAKEEELRKADGPHINEALLSVAKPAHLVQSCFLVYTCEFESRFRNHYMSGCGLCRVKHT